MFKKVTLILLLSVALGAFLVLRPYVFKKAEAPRIEDRLPDADFIGKAYVLDVARETSGMLFYNKIPYRDLFSYEFILGQSKQYGLNLQQPVYYFANENGEWGAIVQVSDSSKIRDGIERLSNFIKIKDTLYDDQQHVYQYREKNGYLTYSNNYLLVYKGTHFNGVFNRVVKAKRYMLSKTWYAFLHEKHFSNEKLVLYSNWDKLKDYGVQKAVFAHDSDSVSFRLKAYIRSKNRLNIAKKSSGPEFLAGNSVGRMLNIHLDVSRLRAHPEDPLYRLMSKYAKRLGFPVKEFLDAWEGDLSLQEGGFQFIKQSYIESELDENFNVTEVEKVKDVKVPGYSLLLSVNNRNQRLISRLFQKGIMTKDEDGKMHFLFSPPLTMIRRPDLFVFYSGSYAPKIIAGNSDKAYWTQDGTRMQLQLDSLGAYTVFGSIYIPVQRLIRQSRFLK